jgi:hypothetical protein
MQLLQFDRPLPSDIETIPSLTRTANRFERNIFEWELDTLVLELLVNAQYPDTSVAADTLRRWQSFARVINALRDFENQLAGCNPPGSILVEVLRIAHRQFPWQRRPNSIWLKRYYKLFSHPELETILHRKIGLSAKDLYRLSLGLLAHFCQHFALDYPPRITIPDLNQAKLDTLLTHIARPLGELREHAQQTHKVDVNYPYLFNPLRVYPVIHTCIAGRSRLIAPIPTLLFRRFTEGIYYEINREYNFSTAFGNSFQSYVGEAIQRANKSGALAVYSEAEYWVGKERKDTVDWMVADQTAALFIESKTKRLVLEAKIEIRSTEALERELDKLADFLLQLYKTIRDYRDGHYRHIPYDPSLKIYPIVLTLEEWFAFGPKVMDEVDRRLHYKLMKSRLDPDWPHQMPYSVVAAEDFEGLLQVIAAVGIDFVMAKKTVVPEPQQWTMGAFLHHEFATELCNAHDLFPEATDEITGSYNNL